MLNYFMAVLFGVFCSSFIVGIDKMLRGQIQEGLFYVLISVFVVLREYMVGGVFYKQKK